MKTYSDASSDLTSTINRMQIAYHPDLQGVTVGALFVFDEESSAQVLKYQGYPAGAVVRISPLRDRALGIADAVIIVDRAYWQSLSAAQKDALLDHELEHLERATDEETGKPKRDALGRPKLNWADRSSRCAGTITSWDGSMGLPRGTGKHRSGCARRASS